MTAAKQLSTWSMLRTCWLEAALCHRADDTPSLGSRVVPCTAGAESAGDFSLVRMFDRPRAAARRPGLSRGCFPVDVVDWAAELLAGLPTIWISCRKKHPALIGRGRGSEGNSEQQTAELPSPNAWHNSSISRPLSPQSVMPPHSMHQ